MNVYSVELQTRAAFTELYHFLSGKGLRLSVVSRGEPSQDTLRLFFTHPDEIAVLLSTFLCEIWKPLYLRHLLTIKAPCLEADELEYISLLVLHEVRRNEIQTQHETLNIQEAIMQSIHYAQEASVPIMLDMIARFRFQQNLQLVEWEIDHQLQQFFSDREYAESVEILRLILDEQPQHLETFDVYITNHHIWICNQTGELVRDREMTQALMRASASEEIHPEDFAMSLLITKSPQWIKIHNLAHNQQYPTFAETLKRVFRERAIFCGGCSTCQLLHQQQIVFFRTPGDMET